MNLVLCQCSSSPKVGGLLACDLLRNFFPVLFTPAVAALGAPPQAASLLHHHKSMCLKPHCTPSLLHVCFRTSESLLEKQGIWQLPRAPTVLYFQLLYALSDWPQGAQVMQLVIPAVTWVWQGASFVLAFADLSWRLPA